MEAQSEVKWRTVNLFVDQSSLKKISSDRINTKLQMLYLLAIYMSSYMDNEIINAQRRDPEEHTNNG